MLAVVDKLAKLDHVAGYNMFKGYKRIGFFVGSWKAYYEKAVMISKKMHNAPAKEVKTDKKLDKIEQRNFDVLKKNLSNSFDITKKDKKAEADALQKLNKCNNQIEELNNQMKEIIGDKSQVSEQDQIILAQIIKDKIKLLNQKKVLDDTYYDLVSGYNKDKSNTVRHYLGVGSSRIGEEKEKYKQKYDEMIEGYDDTLILTTEIVNENRAFVSEFLNFIKKQGSVNTDEDKKNQVLQINDRMINTQNKKFSDDRLTKSVFGGFLSEEKADVEMTEKQKMLDDLLEAHNTYLDKAQMFQLYYIKAEDVYDEIQNMNFNEDISKENAVNDNETLSKNYTEINKNINEIESSKITDENIMQLNKLLKDASTG